MTTNRREHAVQHGSIEVAGPLRQLLGSKSGAVGRALAWHTVQGVARIATIVIIAILAGRLVAGDLTAGFVWIMSGAILLLVLVAFGAAVAGNGFLYPGAYGVGSDLRYSLLRGIVRAPVGEIQKLPRGEVTTVVDRDVADVEQFLNGVLPNLTSAVIAPALLVIVISIIDPVVGLALLVATALTAIGYRLKLRAQARQFHVRRRLRASQDERIIEFVQGIEVAKAFGLSSKLTSRLADSLDEYRNENLRAVRHTIPISASLKAGASFVGGVLLAITGWRFSEGALTPSDTAVLLVLVAGTTLALLEFGRSTGALPGTSASLRRIKDLLSVPEAPVGPGGPNPSSHEVRFQDVRFAYDADEPVLKGVTFEAAEGSVTAITGKSGAGKTTILHLIAGLWQPDHGSVSIGDIDLSQLSPAQRDSVLTIVLQEPYLPDGTVREAIAAGRDVTDTEIEAAARAARCWDVITALPNGLDTMVGEGGGRLSGGERQRVSIARALIVDAPIVCLDEATAALDATTERALQEAMAALLRDRTVIVVAHRPQTIRAADRIVVLEDGVVAETGSHDDLLAQNGVYAARTRALEAASRRGFKRP